MNENVGEQAAAAEAAKDDEEQKLREAQSDDRDAVVITTEGGSTGDAPKVESSAQKKDENESEAENSDDGSDETTDDSESAQDLPKLTFTEFLIRIGETGSELSNFEKELQTTLQNIVDTSADADANQEKIQQLFTGFAEEYDGYKEKLAFLLDGLDVVGDQVDKNPEVTQKVDDVLAISRRIELISQKKDLAFILNSKYKEALAKRSLKEAIDDLENLTEQSGGDAQEAKRVATKLEKVLDFSEMGIDGLIKLNENSSVDTFLAFLIDPVRVAGRNGEKLNFGTTEVDGKQVENVPLPLFRELFKDVNKTAKALKQSAKKINADWANKHESQLRDFDKGEVDPKVVRDLLQNMFVELFIKSGNSDENKKNFRLHFIKELTGSSQDQILDSRSYSFFAELMFNDAEKLNKFWNIPS